MATTKYCPDCEKHISVDEFGKCRSRTDGLTSYCRKHTSDRDRAKYARKAPARRERQRVKRLQAPAKIAESQRRSKLKTKYGLTIEEHDAMIAASKGCCAICQQPKPLQIDHCHVTRRVRGLLCWQCNVALGNMNDSVEQLQAAIAYLQAS